MKTKTYILNVHRKQIHSFSQFFQMLYSIKNIEGLETLNEFSLIRKPSKSSKITG